jgi:competence protein ComEC
VRAALRRSIAEPQAALAVGVVTGDRTSIPQDVQEAFLRSGTTHIMAISGQNISLLVGAVWLFYSGVTRRQRMSMWMLLMVLLILAAYTLFTGATPSVVRAAIIGGILLAAPLLRRRADPVAALGVSASLMVLADPNLLANWGFRFSFTAMVGIVFLGLPVYNTLKRFHVPNILNLLISTGMAAQAGAGPIVILDTGIASLVSVPASITAQIALLPLMISGILTGLLGLISDQVAALTGYAAWLCASWLLWWVEFWGSLPWAASDIRDTNPLWVSLYYSVLGVALWLMEKRKRWGSSARMLPATGLLILAAIAVGVWVVLVAMLMAR